MNNKEKRARFRELAKQERIRTATELAEEHAQPYLPLFNEFPRICSEEKRPARRGQSGGRRHEIR